MAERFGILAKGLATRFLGISAVKRKADSESAEASGFGMTTEFGASVVLDELASVAG